MKAHHRHPSLSSPRNRGGVQLHIFFTSFVPFLASLFHAGPAPTFYCMSSLPFVSSHPCSTATRLDLDLSNHVCQLTIKPGAKELQGISRGVGWDGCCWGVTAPLHHSHAHSVPPSLSTDSLAFPDQETRLHEARNLTSSFLAVCADSRHLN